MTVGGCPLLSYYFNEMLRPLLLLILSLFSLPSLADISLNELLALSPNEPQGSFTYENPRQQEGSCPVPLSLVEKLEQQKQKSPGDLYFGKYKILTFFERSNVVAVLEHPQILLNLSKIIEIKKYVEAQQVSLFPANKYVYENDEADAFRHFLFVTLLHVNFKASLAEKILDSHERFDRRISTLMDRYNNRAVMLQIRPYLKKIKSMSEEELIDFSLKTHREMIQTSALVILEPQEQRTPMPSIEFYQWAHSFMKDPLP